VHALLEERVQKSEVLREWWHRQGPGRKGGPVLAEVVAKLQRLGEQVGEEVVIAFVPRPRGREDRHHVLFLAEPRSSGLRAFLESELFAGVPKPPRLVFVTNVAAMPAGGADLYVLVRPDLVAASSDRATLRAAVSAFDGKTSGLDDTPFGRRIADAYRDGTGLLVAADASRATYNRPPEASGLGDVQHFIAERTEIGGRAQNRAELLFSGRRRGIPSWLGAPAPMGALEFVSPEAVGVASFVTKNPALVFDDMLGFHEDRSKALRELGKLESQFRLRLREDVAAALGSDFTIALDGPMLPVPAFKLIAEVYDSARLESSLQTLVEALKREMGPKEGIDLEHEQAAGRTFHRLRLRGDNGATVEIHYTFADGYLVAAPSRALVLKAIAVRDSGRSLARSPRFTGLWPTDGHTHVSALLYQNLASLAGAAADAAPGAAMSPEQRQAVADVVARLQPSLVYAVGEEDRIQVAGDLFHFDPGALAVPAFLKDAFERRMRSTQ
jgi:hypothetical protein